MKLNLNIGTKKKAHSCFFGLFAFRSFGIIVLGISCGNIFLLGTLGLGLVFSSCNINLNEQSIQVGSPWSWQPDRYEAWEHYEEDVCSRPLLQVGLEQVQVEGSKKKSQKRLHPQQPDQETKRQISWLLASQKHRPMLDHLTDGENARPLHESE